jgi:ABC-type multidrug transport system fused ATPase/permease subunit
LETAVKIAREENAIEGENYEKIIGMRRPSASATPTVAEINATETALGSFAARLMAVAEAYPQLKGTEAYQKAMDKYFGVTSPEQAILVLTIGFIVLYIVRGVAKILYQYWQERKVASYRAELATRLFSNVMHKPYAWHLTHNTAETQRLVNNDVFRVFMILGSLIS